MLLKKIPNPRLHLRFSYSVAIAPRMPFGLIASTICCVSSLIIALTSDYARSQVVPDNSLGNESSVVTPSALIPNFDEITGGARRGSNLFHSFEQFNIEAARQAFFGSLADPNSLNGIENIINRVTGSSRSEIFGTLGVLGSANLFLINPNGIIFGPNARLSIGGSFVGTTADAIGFGSQGIFSALLPETPPLLTVKPSALLFNQIANQPITVQSTAGLQLTGNRSLFLVGGDVNLERTLLRVQGGRIDIGGLAGTGRVGLNIDGENLGLNFPSDAARADISLNGTIVETDSGRGTTSGLGRGNIQVQGRRVTLTEGSEITASNFGAQSAGTLTVNASESIELTALSRLLAEAEGSGSGGELTIETPKLIVRSGSEIAAGAFNQGSGGRLNIKASEVELSGTSENGDRKSSILTQTSGAGNAGELRIESDRLTVEDGARVSTVTTGEGDAGRLTIISSDFVRLIGTSTSLDNPQPSGLFASAEGENSGKPGDLNIETKQLIIQDGARALTSNLGTASEGGTLTVKASELVQLNGTSTNGEVRSGLLVGTTDVGASGELTIETPLLQVQNGAIVSARTSGQAQGGSVTINASDSIEVIGRSAVGNLEPSSITAETQGIQNAGNLTIETGELSIKDGGEITSSSIGGGSGGNTELKAESINLEQGNIISQTASGDGGNIIINLEDFLVLRDRSTISSTAGTARAGGDGGNITINAENGSIVAAPNENSDITANAFSGRGGRVEIEAAGIFGMVARSREDLVDLLETEQPNELDASRLETNDITAISQENPDLSGVVTINALENDPTPGLIVLPSVPIDVRLAQACGGSTAQNQSEFYITGTGGIPPSPLDYLQEESVNVGWVSLPDELEGGEGVEGAEGGEESQSQIPNRIVEATGWIVDGNGDILFVAQAVNTLPQFNNTSCLKN